MAIFILVVMIVGMLGCFVLKFKVEVRVKIKQASDYFSFGCAKSLLGLAMWARAIALILACA